MSDFAVIGGGLVGSAVAWGLARAGARVTLLDEGDDALRASRGNFGLVWVQGKGDGMSEYAAWTRNSADRWPALAAAVAEESGIDVGLRQPGGLEPCLDDQELEERASTVRRMHNQPGVGGNEVQMISGDEARALEPALGPDVIGASWCAHDGHVSPLYLLSGLHTGLRTAGVDHRLNHEVAHIARSGDGFRLETRSGPVHADRVVLAAGLGNARLAPMVGLNVPTGPERGHILVTERLGAMLHHPLARLRQTEEGTVMIGASADRVGTDTRLDLATMASLASRARRLVPALGGVRVVRAWAALRVLSPDGFPVYAESKSHPGAFVVTCHSGVTLAAAHAMDLAPTLLDGSFGGRFAAFDPARFADRSAAQA